MEPAVPVAGRMTIDGDGCVVAADSVAAVSAGSRSLASANVGTRNASGNTGSGAGTRPAGNPAPLRPGMFARVTTVFAVKESAVVVPEEAIVPQAGRQFVIKVVDSSMVPAGAGASTASDTRLVSLRQEVKLGARQSGKVEVTEGLVEGETVVVAGQQRLQRDGTSLRVVDLSRPGQGAGGAAAPAKAGASAPAAGTSAATSP